LNNSSNLAPFTKDGLELVIDLKTGASYAPGYRALARICSLGLEKPIRDEQVKRYISSLVKGATISPLLKAEIQTAGGLQGATLIPENLMAKTIRKFNGLLSDRIDEAGMRVFAHQLAGYRVSSNASQTQTSAEALVQMANELLTQDRRMNGIEGTVKIVQGNVEIVQEDVKELKVQVKMLKNFYRRVRSGLELRLDIEAVLCDPALQNLPNTQIAVICGCSESMIRKYKDERVGIFRTKKTTKKTTKVQVTIDVEVGEN
jgi:hypothetical protein